MTIDSISPQYVRFARALALVTTVALPACGSAADPSPAPGIDPDTAPSAAPAATTEAATGASASATAPQLSTPKDATRVPLTFATDAASPDDAATLVAFSDDAATEPKETLGALDAAVDAALPHPHTSGPLAPPELPFGMA